MLRLRVGIEEMERNAVKRLLATTLLAAVFVVTPLLAFANTNVPTVVVAVGAPGEPEFGSNFVEQVELWKKTCDRAKANVVRIGLEETNSPTDAERLKQVLTAEATNGMEPLWLVMIGHGTFDGKEARFNLRGPDVSATELAEWLKPLQRPLIVIDCTSCSAPFLNKLSGTNRVIVTATRSGNEANFARFGLHFAEALADDGSDLDKDGQVSLLEAFLMASRNVAEFYKSEGRLATEHALIDDNGDGLGTPADWFRGVRAIKKAKDSATLDGTRAQQFHLVLSAEEQALTPEIRARRNDLELAVARLRESKAQMAEDEYYKRLEALLLELARLDGQQHR